MSTELPTSRRTVLLSGMAAMGTALSTRTGLAADDENTPWIDAHSHIWTPDTSKFGLRPGMTVDDLQPRSFTDAELMAIARPQGVGRVVLIQHTYFHGFDNAYLIDAWRRHPDLFRVVGMVDDLWPNCGRAMKQLLPQGVTGFRITPRKGISEWLQTDGMTEMWQTAAETGQSMCCLINPENLPQVDAACRRHPDTPVVIDHFARIGIDGTIRDSDLNSLCKLAVHKNVKVKISAYYALGRKQPPHHELIPMIRRLYETFGADRLMWASDCPYQLDGNNTYESSIALIRDTIDFVSDAERRQLLRDTAEQTFFF
ncbi:MAG: amidohydrolase family protein [Fuerstiella sp.]